MCIHIYTYACTTQTKEEDPRFGVSGLCAAPRSNLVLVTHEDRLRSDEYIYIYIHLSLYIYIYI